MKKEIRFVIQFIGISVLSLVIACSLSSTKTHHREIKKIEVKKNR